MIQQLAVRFRGVGLLARFTLIGALVGISVAGALAWYIETRVTDLALDQVAERAIDQVDLGISRQVVAADFEPPHTPEKLAGLNARLAPVLSHLREDRGGLIRLHVFAPDGTVIFSDLPAKRGQVVPPSTLPLLQGALNGIVGQDVSSLTSPENFDLKARYGSALEVYVPFLLNGQVVGAYEIYHHLESVRPVRPLVWGGVLGGFTLLFLSLLVVVREAAAQIRRQQAERERLLQQAAEADALREVDRLKDELMSVVSHELRAPLTSVVGFADLLLMRDFPESERQRLLGIISEEGQRLSALINDFLDIQRMESGQGMVNTVPSDLRTILTRAVAVVGEDGEHPLLLDLPDELPPVVADPSRVQQVLINLLANARKYSPQGGDVHLSARLVEDAVEVAVRDDGLGLPAEALPRLFQKFYRVSGTERQAIKGTGLGLAICKKIIELHGGSIWAESDGPGSGSRFCFTLPLAEATSPR